MTLQGQLVPIVCTRTKPPPATADADFIAIDEASTERYLCKGQSRARYLPASEWICSHLARACGLPVPPVAVIELATRPGSYFFGSQWLGGALDPAMAFRQVSNPELFATTHAVDLFTHNDDRHLGNYLYLELAGDVVMRVIDFSRAWMHHGWPLPSLPLSSSCQTINCLPAWRQEYAAHYIAPLDVLTAIGALPDEWMRDILEPMPSDWLSHEERIRLRQWWVGSARKMRLAKAQSCLP